jgi:hypothetical protein
MKLVKKALAVAALALLAPTASMATLVSSGASNPLSFSWAYNTGSSVLTGSGSMTISGFNTSLLTVAVSLSNTSSIGGIGGERLTAFGFGIDPNATGVAFGDVGDGGIVNAKLNQNFPGYSTVEVCAFGGSTCAGGGNGGIYAGTTDSFTLLLAGTWGSSVNIDPLALKYQTGYGSFEFSPTTGKLAEPSSIALAGLGFGLAGIALRRRRQNAA